MTTNTTTGKKKVIILGGGVAGLSAAHHLLTRGEGRFDVEVYERRNLGGKARSGEENNLPNEHGFRFFPGFYKHITKTMKEIPLKSGGNVYDNNLVNTDYYTFLFSNKPGRLDVPLNVGGWVKKFQFRKILNMRRKLLAQIEKAAIDITDEGHKKLVESMLEVYTSCNARIDSTYDNISWREFIDAGDRFGKYGKDYENLLATGISKNLVAVRADIANARTGAKLIGHMLWHIVAPSAPPADKILNAPTNIAWINPWRDYLVEKGLKIHTDRRAVCLEFNPEQKQVTGFRHDDVEVAAHQSWRFYDSRKVIEALPLESADYLICAMPVERLDEMLERSVCKNHKIKTYDHTLANFDRLWKNTEWMTGIMFYFDTEIPISRGHITIADEPAAITIISQMQYWTDYLKTNKIRDKNGVEVKAILSTIVSDWDAHSKYIARKNVKLKDLQEDEVIEEIREILFRCEIKEGLKLDYYRNNLLGAFMDESIVPYNEELANPRFRAIEGPFKLYNKEPLFINKVHSYHLRPTGYTAFKNLFLASDYIKSNADLGCMDSADEAARRAVNNILEKEKIKRDCAIDLYNLPSFFGLFGTARIIDYRDFKRGLQYNKENIVRRVIMWFVQRTFNIFTSKLPFILQAPLFAGLALLFLLVVIVNFIVRFFLKMIYVRSI